MTRLAALGVAVSLALSSPLAAQRPAFEAVSLKQNMSGDTGARGQVLPGGRVRITNNTVRNILRNYFRLQDYQIAGGPDWIGTARWDLVAKAEGDPRPEVMIEMLRALFKDRFKLVTHMETREMPIYALVLARPDRRLAAQLHVSPTDCVALEAASHNAGGAPPPPPGAAPPCGINSSTGRIQAGARTMVDVARALSQVTGRAVVDKTGLNGVYDLEVNWNDAAEGPSLFTAVQEQLGLKLDAQRGPVEVLVIDSAQRPTED